MIFKLIKIVFIILIKFMIFQICSRMASNSDGSGEYRGIYCNVDGLTQPKLNEISDITSRDTSLLFI